jgi:hypothetical protein
LKRSRRTRSLAIGAIRFEGARLLVALALALAALALLPQARAATYKWVDEKGVVHYTDKIPAEQVDKANTQLDKQGRQIKKTEPAPSLEQRKAKAEEEARQKELAKERELVERRDRALLASYTTESEIDLARRRALATIEQQMDSSTAYTTQLNKRKGELDARKGAQSAIGADRELANINIELGKQADLIAAKQKEIILVNARYDADKKRWRELRAATEAQTSGQPSPMRPTTAQK